MKARLVEESINEFHQSGDPIKALDLGVHNVYEYVGRTCKENNLNPEQFWEDHVEYLVQGHSEYDLYEIIMEIVGDLVLDKQINFIKSDLESWVKSKGAFNI